MSTKWRKYRKTCKQACLYVFVQENYIKAHVLMYFLHLVLTFTPHYIIMVKGLLRMRPLTNLKVLGTIFTACALVPEPMMSDYIILDKNSDVTVISS